MILYIVISVKNGNVLLILYCYHINVFVLCTSEYGENISIFYGHNFCNFLNDDSKVKLRGNGFSSVLI